MLDINKELKALSEIKHSPGDTLRQSTRALVRDEVRRMQTGEQRVQKKPVRWAVRWAAVCAAAAAAILFAALILSPVHTAQAAGYYTVDINPSVTLSVDKDDVVLSVTAGNEDAIGLLEDTELAGLPIGEALDVLVRAAAEGGWLADSGHVLVAHFGDTPGISEQLANDIVSSAAGDSVNVLVLQSTKDDYKAAEKQHKNAGLELLKKNAQSLGIDGGMDVDDVISAIDKKHNPQSSNGQSSNGQSSNGQGSNGQGSHKPDTAQSTEKPTPTTKPSPTPKPAVTKGQNNGNNGQQNNGKGNDDKPDKQTDSEKPDKDGSKDSGNSDHEKNDGSQGGSNSGNNRNDGGKSNR